ncbi:MULTISPECIES: alpha/beta fold hydrolase [Phenylobacterium]|uniref:Pimeloyl-ACP methyl ester carboxylesterase n=1 Tax=Phenylobacterium koreense TaxID=266125 RepID=A0ABV2EKZ6_9CAUL
MRLLITIAVSMLSAAPAAASIRDEAAGPGQLVRLPGGRHLNFRCSGHGTPTILLEGGYGATSLAWGGVRRHLDASYRVCAYDRAGAGFSDPGPLPRDGASIAYDLDRGLRTAKIRGPFVLVGHSAGALYMRLFYNRRPQDVVGMALIDPSIEHQDQRFAAMFGPGAGGIASIRDQAARCAAAAEQKELPSTDPKLARCVPKPRANQSEAAYAAQKASNLSAASWQAKVSELDTLFAATSEQIEAGPQSYGDLPLLVLTAGQTYESSSEEAQTAARNLWWGLHRELARRSTRGESRRIAEASHMMITEEPELVAQAVSEVARRAKEAK